ncbi:hypothetical protein KRR40_46120 [Niabella defluvii]|nr:hypothetical protein KRR40_46120 [Niabella sp. I65]
MVPGFPGIFSQVPAPAIIIWGRHDVFYDLKEAYCFLKDLPDATVHVLEGGHMALETNFDEVCGLIDSFMSATTR